MFQDVKIVANCISGGLSLSLADAWIFKGILLIELYIWCLSSSPAPGLAAVVHQSGASWRTFRSREEEYPTPGTTEGQKSSVLNLVTVHG